ncbi:MAG: carbohydrate ABC transporter permease [Kineosporiaceae bacterium]|nr:carbohydrate ABC transporter permease [Kineosporiaceae bacterium]
MGATRQTSPPAASRAPRTARAPRRWRLPFSGWHLVLMPLALLFATPLVQMVLSSLKTNAEIRRFPPTLLPRDPTLSGFVQLFTESDVLRWIANSVLVASCAVLAQVLLCSMAGYGFSRMRFLGRTGAFVLIIATMMIPTQLLMIPTYVMFSRVGIVNTLPSIIVPWLTSAFGVFLMRQFFLSLPAELEEAARLDGCSAFGVFWRIILPLAKPALATLAIFTLLGSWNDLIWPLISISDDRWFTLQLGLANFQGTRRTEWQMLMAGNVVATMPLIVFFVLAQKHFIATMTFSGLKG